MMFGKGANISLETSRPLNIQYKLTVPPIGGLHCGGSGS